MHILNRNVFCYKTYLLALYIHILDENGIYTLCSGTNFAVPSMQTSDYILQQSSNSDDPVRSVEPNDLDDIFNGDKIKILKNVAMREFIFI